MNRQRLLRTATAFLLGATAHAAEPQTLTIKDWTGRGFAPDVVTYEVDGAQAKKVRVVDSAGQPMPVQVTQTKKGPLLLS